MNFHFTLGRIPENPNGIFLFVGMNYGFWFRTKEDAQRYLDAERTAFSFCKTFITIRRDIRPLRPTTSEDWNLFLFDKDLQDRDTGPKQPREGQIWTISRSGWRFVIELISKGTDLKDTLNQKVWALDRTGDLNILAGIAPNGNISTIGMFRYATLLFEAERRLVKGWQSLTSSVLWTCGDCTFSGTFDFFMEPYRNDESLNLCLDCAEKHGAFEE